MTPTAKRQTSSQPTPPVQLLMVPGQPPVGPATEGSDPWQLQFYDVVTCDIIKRAKQFSHCNVVSINTFPLCANSTSRLSSISTRLLQNDNLMACWWSHYGSGITRLLWEDLRNWHSALKKKAHGHTNNLAHPVLSGLVVDFFYTGATSIGKLFPEVFESKVPRVAVAMAITALEVALDKIVGGPGEVNFRVGVYSPVDLEILGLMAKCDTLDIRAAKMKALWMQWVRMGSNSTKDRLSIAATAFGFDVDVD
ncbi:hypothetical protein BDN67DRAFT_1017496 [Paxillus ammoniavirescens]|nr:hypothetical protein BDN67DRAFT_1017496 [Paxillus ammoniavirescens]